MTSRPADEAHGEEIRIEQLQERVQQTLGMLRAEYLRAEIFDLWTRPSYWPELLGSRPCFLVGGRGTGKTTVLRGLTYEGQHRLVGPTIPEWESIGLYWRVSTNTVAAFRGGGQDEAEWTRLFSHYVNLQMMQLILRFITWRSDILGETTSASADGIRRATLALGVPATESLSSLTEAVADELALFESSINNVSASAEPPRASMLGRPLDHLVEALQADPTLRERDFVFCIDEYENLENYQQRVLNTLIKHVGDSFYTFKVGVRETGLRERSTLNPTEQLIEPADYTTVDITKRLKDEDFVAFARTVCNERLRLVPGDEQEVPSVDWLLPGLTETQEARLLGIDSRIRQLRSLLEEEGATHEDLAFFDSLEPLSAYLVGYWARSAEVSVSASLAAAQADPREWQTRLGNYSYATLFTIRPRVRGTKKYYAGWATYAQLADGNIRYLLQLVTEALTRHLSAGKDLESQITPQLQTEAATDVGRRAVHELQGLTARGAQLTKLVLGMGRVFQVMAADPYGHAPEVAQFRVNSEGDETAWSETQELLGVAVLHQAMVRFPGDKMAAVSGETKGFDYQLHPIMSPFFVFTHRRKRRMTVTAGELLGLVANPPPTIRAILSRSQRSADIELPDQLELFAEFFDESA